MKKEIRKKKRPIERKKEIKKPRKFFSKEPRNDTSLRLRKKQLGKKKKK